MAAHSYWRVRNLIPNGNPISCAELEMRASIGGANECVGGTPIASSEYSSGYAKGYAFDGTGAHDGQEWAAAGNGDNEYIGYHFAAPVDIAEIAYTARQYYGSQSPNKAVLEYSDTGVDGSWTVKFGLNFGAFSNGETKVKSATAALPEGSNPHKFWRINFLTNAGGLSSGREGELHLAPGGVDVTDDNVVIFTDAGHYSDWSFSRMFDGDLNLLAAIGGSPSWAQAEFLTPVTLEEFVWRCRNGGGANYQVPLTGNVAWSDNGSDFTVAWTWDASEGWADDETKTFTNPDAGAGPPPRRRQALVIC